MTFGLVGTRLPRPGDKWEGWIRSFLFRLRAPARPRFAISAARRRLYASSKTNSLSRHHACGITVRPWPSSSRDSARPARLQRKRTAREQRVGAKPARRRANAGGKALAEGRRNGSGKGRRGAVLRCPKARLRQGVEDGKATGKNAAGNRCAARLPCGRKTTLALGDGDDGFELNPGGAAGCLAFAAHALKTPAVGGAGMMGLRSQCGCCMDIQYPADGHFPADLRLKAGRREVKGESVGDSPGEAGGPPAYARKPRAEEGEAIREATHRAGSGNPWAHLPVGEPGLCGPAALRGRNVSAAGLRRGRRPSRAANDASAFPCGPTSPASRRRPGAPRARLPGVPHAGLVRRHQCASRERS